MDDYLVNVADRKSLPSVIPSSPSSNSVSASFSLSSSTYLILVLLYIPWKLPPRIIVFPSKVDT